MQSVLIKPQRALQRGLGIIYTSSTFQLKGIYRTDCAGEPNLKVIKSKIVSLVYFEKGVATAVTALKSLNVFESVFVTQEGW